MWAIWDKEKKQWYSSLIPTTDPSKSSWEVAGTTRMQPIFKSKRGAELTANTLGLDYEIRRVEIKESE